jgi:hypothetical protein
LVDLVGDRVLKNSIQLLSSAAALYMFAAVAPASALTMKAFYTGIVSSGTEFNIADQSGMFGLGTGAGVLNDQAFTLTFTYNPLLFGVVHDDTPTRNVARGGPLDIPGSHSPIYNAELLINGVTKKIFSNAAGFVGNYNPISGYNNAFHSTFSQYIDANFNVTENYVDGGIGDIRLLIPLGLETPYHVVLDTLLSLSNGHFDFNVFDDNLRDYSVHTFGTFSATELTVSTVPLPGALPLFAAGLIWLGAVSRKRA